MTIGGEMLAGDKTQSEGLKGHLNRIPVGLWLQRMVKGWSEGTGEKTL